jgi:DNA-binding beta-propeller fold protein YncE
MISGFVMLPVLTGQHSLNFFNWGPDAVTVKTEMVEVGPGNNVFQVDIDPVPSDVQTPAITSLDLKFDQNNTAELIITGDRFSSQPGAKATVTFQVGNMDPVTVPINSVDGESRVRVPNSIVLGLADITVSREDQVLQGSSGGGVFSFDAVESVSNSARISPEGGLIFAGRAGVGATAFAQDITGEIRRTLDLEGGSEVAVTSDLTRAYVSRGFSKPGIAVIDALTLQQVMVPLPLDVTADDECVDGLICLPDKPGGAFSLAIDPLDRFLYAGGSAGEIYVIDIRPDAPLVDLNGDGEKTSPFHKVVRTILVRPGSRTGQRVNSLTVSADGKRLYAAVLGFRKNGGASNSPARTEGEIVVINIDPNDAVKQGEPNPRLWRRPIKTFTKTDGNIGIDPGNLLATSDPHKLLFSNFFGPTKANVGAITVTNDDPSNFRATITYANARVVPPSQPQGNLRDLYLDLTNPAGIAFLPANTFDPPHPAYAFVADWGPALLGSSATRFVDPTRLPGAKIGVIKDPFGPNPQLMGSTTPIPDGYADSVVLSVDNMRLYAGYRGSGGVLVFDVKELIKTAESKTVKTNTVFLERMILPLDVINPKINLLPINTSVIVDGHDGLDGRPDHTHIVGSPGGLATQPQALTVVVLPDQKFGDVIKVDLKELLTSQFGQADYQDFRPPLEMSNGQIAKDLNAAQDKQILQDIGTTQTFSDTGVFFFVPEIDIDRVRRGESLDSVSVRGTFQYRIGDDKEVKTATVVIQLEDGYEEIVLNKPVDQSKTNERLDVYRIQQRLKYFGFTAHGGTLKVNKENNRLEASQDAKELLVDGNITSQTVEAIKLFQAVIENENPFEPRDDKKVSGVVEKDDQANSNQTIDLLNAEDAPRWVELIDDAAGGPFDIYRCNPPQSAFPPRREDKSAGSCSSQNERFGSKLGDVPLIVKPDDGLLGKYTTAGMG